MSVQKIKSFEILDHGVEHSQYFQGCGVSFTKYADVATGIGHSARSAFHDALEQLCNCYDVAPLEIEAERLSDEDTIRPLLEECSDEESELYHRISIRVLGEESWS